MVCLHGLTHPDCRMTFSEYRILYSFHGEKLLILFRRLTAVSFIVLKRISCSNDPAHKSDIYEAFKEAWKVESLQDSAQRKSLMLLH